MEGEIAGISGRLHEIEAWMADSDHYKDSNRVIETNREHRAFRERLDPLHREWEALSIESEKLTARLREELDKIR